MQYSATTTAKVNSVEEAIMCVLKVDRWTSRCDVARNYFGRNATIDEVLQYRKVVTKDSNFLYRTPQNKKNVRRYGVCVGIDTFGSKNAASVFIVREAVEN